MGFHPMQQRLLRLVCWCHWLDVFGWSLHSYFQLCMIGANQMLVKEAIEFGRISKGNTKMPGTSFAIDAFACNVGSKLAKIKGTPCFGCYARKLQKLRPSVDKGYKSNLTKFNNSNIDGWIASMVFQIDRSKTKYHRWFDSGDLQSVKMFKAIIDVCLMTPQVKHWLPTQERAIIEQVKSIPDNLVIRLSGSKITGRPPNYTNTSTGFDKHGAAYDRECKARTRGNQCGSCRSCWNRNISNVSYPKH